MKTSTTAEINSSKTSKKSHNARNWLGDPPKDHQETSSFADYHCRRAFEDHDTARSSSSCERALRLYDCQIARAEERHYGKDFIAATYVGSEHLDPLREVEERSTEYCARAAARVQLSELE